MYALDDIDAMKSVEEQSKLEHYRWTVLIEQMMNTENYEDTQILKQKNNLLFFILFVKYERSSWSPGLLFINGSMPIFDGKIWTCIGPFCHIGICGISKWNSEGPPGWPLLCIPERRIRSIKHIELIRFSEIFNLPSRRRWPCSWVRCCWLKRPLPTRLAKEKNIDIRIFQTNRTQNKTIE